METQFSWTKQWYPISPLSYLNFSSPNTATLLGKKLVIWRDANQKWIVMDDCCAHKLAQLSLGSINEEGNLMCRHHGWCFNGEGKCTKVPMLTGEAEETACDSFRSHVTTYPTQILQELLWVWPDDSVSAWEDCTLKHPAILPECEFDISFTDWRLSEVPVGYTVSVESSFDPSHAQFLHEGIAHFSPKTAVPIKEFAIVDEISAEEGFTLKHTGYNLFNKDMNATRKFTPPCSSTTVYRFPNGKSNIFQLYFVPTQPGYCRYIGKVIFDSDSVPKKSLFNLLPKYLQTGLQHLAVYKLSDQDLTVMHSQEVNESLLHKQWQKAYFVPSPADVGIVTFRKWLDEFAGGSPGWADSLKDSAKDLNTEQLYDRWHRHTKLCPNCSSSVLLIEQVRTICQIVTGLLLLLALGLMLIGISLKIGAIAIILAILSFLSSSLLEDFKQVFISSIPKRGLPVVTLYKSKKIH